MTLPKWLRRDQPQAAETALTPEAERILKALEQGQRATMRPMPAPQRSTPASDSPRQQ